MVESNKRFSCERDFFDSKVYLDMVESNKCFSCERDFFDSKMYLDMVESNKCFSCERDLFDSKLYIYMAESSKCFSCERDFFDSEVYLDMAESNKCFSCERDFFDSKLCIDMMESNKCLSCERNFFDSEVYLDMAESNKCFSCERHFSFLCYCMMKSNKLTNAGGASSSKPNYLNVVAKSMKEAGANPPCYMQWWAKMFFFVSESFFWAVQCEETQVAIEACIAEDTVWRCYCSNHFFKFFPKEMDLKQGSKSLSCETLSEGVSFMERQVQPTVGPPAVKVGTIFYIWLVFLNW